MLEKNPENSCEEFCFPASIRQDERLLENIAQRRKSGTQAIRRKSFIKPAIRFANCLEIEFRNRRYD
jgi:hypothetical protein